MGTNALMDHGGVIWWCIQGHRKCETLEFRQDLEVVASLVNEMAHHSSDGSHCR
jgi:hypothetical protein